MDFKEYSLPQNPRAKANPFSKLLFLWMFPLFKKGYKKELQEQDLSDILDEDRTDHVGEKMQR